MKDIGKSRITAVAVTELTAIPSSTGEPLIVTAALYDSKANEIVGMVKHNSIWSKETWDALTRLYSCVETDIANHVSSEGEIHEEAIDSTGTKGGLFPEK